MTKADLIEELRRNVEAPGPDAEHIIDAIFGGIVKALRNHEKVEIRGFGSMHTRQRAARIGRNPKTGARVDVPAKTVACFKPSKELKQLINGVKTVQPPNV